MLKIIIKSSRNVFVFLLVNPYLQEQVAGVDGLTGYSLPYLVGEYKHTALPPWIPHLLIQSKSDQKYLNKRIASVLDVYNELLLSLTKQYNYNIHMCCIGSHECSHD